MESNLQSPFIICPPGTCPNCYGHKLVLIERDIDVSRISEKGIIEESANLDHTSKLVCSDCKSEFDFVKQGFFVVPKSKFSQQFELLSKEKARIENAKNPFSM